MDTEYRKAVARRLRDNAGEDLAWLVPWAVFNDGDEHSPTEVVNALADAVDPATTEAVRCRDCAHACDIAGAGLVCQRLPFRFATEPLRFCAWGERRQP